MPLTPEQREQIRQAKAGGARRVTVSRTPEQVEKWQTAAKAELAASEENVAHVLKIKVAAEQPGFFGDIRRAILSSRRPLDQLAAEAGVEPRALSDFRAGDSDLPSAALDRLLDVLGLRLMQEIPR
jgi:hypothetical protein